MGILQQMVHVLKKLDPDNSHWNTVVMTQAMKDFEKADKLSDEDIEELRKEIEKTFDDGLNYPDYARKLHVIENCIYGVDIQSIAVQISKLRFFISLVCEQRRNTDPTENYGIRPLPNLETKFVAANTLIGIEKNEEDMILFRQDKIQKLVDELKETRHRQFLVTNAQKKRKLREKDEALRHSIVTEVQKLYVKRADEDLFHLRMQLKQSEKELEVLNNKNDIIQTTEELSLFGSGKKKTINITENKRSELRTLITRLNRQITEGSQYTRLESVVNLARQLTSWNPYDQNNHSEFFDPEWMFGLTKQDEGYFDVVIGNPPYVQLQKDGGLLAKQFEKHGYKTFQRTGDIYSLFYEKGWQVLISKGILCFITSNKWMRAGYGESTRKFFAESTNPMILIDFAGQKIFEAATVDTNILLFAKDKNKQQTRACIVKGKILENLSSYVSQKAIECNFIAKESWTILSPIEQSIKQKIERAGTPLKDWNINIYRGVLTGYNDAFIIDGKTKDILINEDAKSAEIIRPILRGKDIKRYGYNFGDMWIINTHNGTKEKGIKPVNINDYPAIKKHLDSFMEDIEKRADQGDTPYNLRNCAYMDGYHLQDTKVPIYVFLLKCTVYI